MRERLSETLNAEGATAPETLRQKDRWCGIKSGEQRLRIPKSLTEGESLAVQGNFRRS
jgi:hypothetical protein